MVPAFAELASLDDRCRDVLLVLALEGARPRSRDHWQARASAAGLRDVPRAPRSGDVVEELVRVGAVLKDARGGHIVAPGWMPRVVDDAHRRGSLAQVARALQATGYGHWSDGLGARAKLLAALASGDAEAIARATTTFTMDPARRGPHAPSVADVLGLELPASWIDRLEAPQRISYLRDALDLAFASALPLGDGVMERALAADDDEVRGRSAMVLALKGEGARALAVLETAGPGPWARGARGFVALVQGDHDEARRLFAEAGRGARGKRLEIVGDLAVFDALLASTGDRERDLVDAEHKLARAKRSFARFPSAAFALREWLLFRQHGLRVAYVTVGERWVDALVPLLVASWTDAEARDAERALALAAAASAAGYAWIGGELTALAGRAGTSKLAGLFSRKEAAASHDRRLHVQLVRAGRGLRARVRALPAGPSGPALLPGELPEVAVIATASGVARIPRDLKDERARLDRLLACCPRLVGLPEDHGDRVAADLGASLEMVLELREAERDADVVLTWPEGRPLRVATPARSKGGSDLRVRVRGDEAWLEIEGELHLDDEVVLDMHALLDGTRRSEGRFIAIGDDAYVALTRDLRAKLESLARLTTLGDGGRVSPGLLPAIESLCEGADVSIASSLGAMRERLARACDLTVRVPRGLRARLRHYQRAGFTFLVRRTEAGVGALLADDMGLGKTVQAIALLLRRRARGPALIVAPTSVCRNWEEELGRFAPSLAVRRVADGGRTSVVTSARAGEVVVASYGRLAAEEELFARRAWATVVFDEAHALKNARTRRWAAARRLTSEAKVALTGTPVENHAGELHALFEVIAPGMLGSRRGFDRALAGPIASGDRRASELLRDLVRPFVVRRTKEEVLRELPPRTDVLRLVSRSTEHAAFYEAVRQRALERVERANALGSTAAPSASIALLAEITRLRRAAIDPRLVAGDAAPRGGKVAELAELCAELRAEGRRALVFSQFLEVLDLARASLEARGVTCLRLDGSMTASARAEAVRTFQSGTSDVFLVSLKAGGVGVNLTAADVVVLLDPWWNPAVEEQAAARAHRFGQTRPVTVVRLVTEGTIEEKVLALHAKKRALYDAVIAGADGRGKLDVDALTALLARG